jgi:hypothetical protein
MVWLLFVKDVTLSFRGQLIARLKVQPTSEVDCNDCLVMEATFPVASIFTIVLNIVGKRLSSYWILVSRWSENCAFSKT